jgi:short-subunit dehydrogenase
MKTVLITGASAGFGKLVAEKLLDEKYVVYAAARRVERMRDLEESGAKILKMDVTSDQDVEDGVARVIEEQGRIDVLFNNAGYGSYGAVESVSMEEIRRQYEVNVFGAARMIQAVLPHMRAQKSGRIINTASVVGHISTPMIGWYASTKHAMEATSDALRMEVKRLGIHVVLIEPGAVRTEFEETALAALDAVDHPEDYTSIASGFRKYIQKMYAKSPGPESTARAVLKAIQTKRPKARYATTFDAKFLPRARRLMGDRLYDAAVLSQFKDK